MYNSIEDIKRATASKFVLDAKNSGKISEDRYVLITKLMNLLPSTKVCVDGRLVKNYANAININYGACGLTLQGQYGGVWNKTYVFIFYGGDKQLYISLQDFLNRDIPIELRRIILFNLDLFNK